MTAVRGKSSNEYATYRLREIQEIIQSKTRYKIISCNNSTDALSFIKQTIITLKSVSGGGFVCMLIETDRERDRKRQRTESKKRTKSDPKTFYMK